MEEKSEEKSASTKQRIVSTLIEEEMKKSYLAYSMSVIVGRALPDARDGLKPVHRRILVAMHSMGMLHNRPYKKSARIVGETLGKYHPHGDTAVYDAMVRMVQTFSLRYPLIDGQGNFGSVDGDRPAAMRYTEARLNRIAEEMLADIEKETVEFVPNFDDSMTEPAVLPAKLPNLLINGSSGIAVGMATNIPPHNLREICQGVIALIDNPEISIEGLMQFVKGPDFPTAGLIRGRRGIHQTFQTGKGKIVIRAKAEIGQAKNRDAIVIKEIPYMVNKSQLVEEIAELVKDKRVQGISDIRDESDREGIRIVLQLKAGVDPEILLNQLYARSRLQVAFGVIMLALVGNQPKILNLKEMMQQYAAHRREIVRKRTEYDLRQAEERSHILAGLIIALQNIDDVVEAIRKSEDADHARATLMERFVLSEKQAQAILDMRLSRLTSLESGKVVQEQEEVTTLIKNLKDILASEQRILEIIKEELRDIQEKYGDARRTQIIEEAKDVDEEDLIEDKENVITITHAGYIKRLGLEAYRQQKRGGKGVIAATAREEDFIEDLFVGSSRSYLLFFTNKGRVHWLKVWEIPEEGRQARGKAITNLLKLQEGERLSACIPVKEFDDRHCLVMATMKGIIKKTRLEEYSRPRQGGIIGITLESEDELENVQLTDQESELILATAAGKAVRFHEEDIRTVGRSGKGVRGIRLKAKDRVIGMVKADPDKFLLTITEKGYGKRTPVSEYRLISRGGSGVIDIVSNERNGAVVAIKCVSDKEEVMVVSQQGSIIRIPISGVGVIGRNTQGVRIMKLEEGDKVVSAALVKAE
ncbi:MAG TPA: DNA gyrase subunit A [Candidatus Nanoarchaeia archaeon]|nr:DNA gyrase subunit A [Candidatus Nanoarchaeia archaeon]